MENNKIESIQLKIDAILYEVDQIDERLGDLHKTYNDGRFSKEFKKRQDLAVMLRKLKNKQINLIDNYICYNIVGEYSNFYDNKEETIKRRLEQWKDISLGKTHNFFSKMSTDFKYSDFIRNITCEQDVICEIKFEGAEDKEIPNIESSDEYLLVLSLQKDIEEYDKKLELIRLKYWGRELNEKEWKEYQEAIYLHYKEDKILKEEQNRVYENFYNENK